VLRLIAGHSDDSFARSMRRKASSIRNCGSHVKGHVCECGHPISDTAKIVGRDGPCDTRSCPVCARRRAGRRVAWAEKILDEIGTGEYENRWMFLTLTTKYNPNDEMDLTPLALRRRANGILKSWRAIWKLCYKHNKNAGAWSAVELAGQGHVHGHVLIYGDYKRKAEIKAAGESGWSGLGHIDIRAIDDCDEKKIMNGVIEALKYQVKGPGASSNVDWTSNQKKELVVHPILAARWEVGCANMRLGDRYGVFRKIKKPLPQEEIEESRVQEISRCRCPECNRENRKLVDVCEPVIDWIRRCRRRKVKPFGKGS